MSITLLYGKPPVTKRDAPLMAADLAQVLDMVRTNPQLRRATAAIRRTKDKVDRKQLKATTLPYVLPFHYGELVRNGRNFLHAEALFFEADHVADLSASLKAAVKHPAVAMAYTSVSGDGFKVLVALDTRVGVEWLARVYPVLARQLGAELHAEMDLACGDLARVQYLSWDPAAHAKEPTAPMAAKAVIDRLGRLDEESTRPGKDDSVPNSAYTSQDIKRAVKWAREHGMEKAKDEQTWWRMSMAIASLGEEGREHFMELSLGNPLYPEDTEARLSKKYGQLMAAWGDYHDQGRVLGLQALFNITAKAYPGFRPPKPDSVAATAVVDADGTTRSLEYELGDRFAALHGERLLFDQSRVSKQANGPTQGWLQWTGKQFKLLQKGEMSGLYREFTDGLKREAARAKEDLDGAADAMSPKQVLVAESKRMRDLTLSWVKDKDGIAMLPDELDKDPDLFNAENGVVDLRTGEVRPHDPKDRMTKLSQSPLDMKAKAPKWEAFISKICLGNRETVEYVQRAVGYSLTGHTSEDCLFFLYGTGANGKSTFFEGLKLVFGDYQTNANYESFAKANRDGSSHSEDVVRLKGARFVISTEAATGKAINDSRLKQMTGGDTLTARDLHQSSIEFKPQFKLWIAGNHKPELENFDEGIRRRIKIIPFAYHFKKEEIRPRHAVVAEFAEERAGIMAWAVRGCVAWQKQPLKVPRAIEEETEAYFLESNLVAGFVRGQCAEGSNFKEVAQDVYTRFRDGVDSAGESAMGRRAFYGRLEELGFRHAEGQEHRTYVHGLRLLTRDEMTRGHARPQGAQKQALPQ